MGAGLATPANDAGTVPRSLVNNPISLDGIDLLLGVPCRHQRIRETNMSPENTVERMTTEQVRKFLWDALRDFDAGKITAVERRALVRAANKRLRDIRKKLGTQRTSFRRPAN
jgi:hypothetical protein